MTQMYTPYFWTERGWRSHLLLPLAGAYRAGAALRARLAAPQEAGAPVLCVGNLTAGGAGKTPTVIALAQLLRTRGVEAHVLSRGYGGALAGPVRVEPDRHTFTDVGDEPLLIARHAPCWVAKRRVDAACAAVQAGAKLLILDDGLQNPALRKDASLAVVDGGYGFGNGRILPAGPLREPVAAGLRRARAVLLIGEDETGALAAVGRETPVFRASLVLAPKAAARGSGRILAFAGIGRPEKFFSTLRREGLEIVGEEAFPDHYPYRACDLERLAQRAQAANATLATTEKDAVRLPAAFRAQVAAIPARLRLETPDALLTCLLPLL